MRDNDATKAPDAEELLERLAGLDHDDAVRILDDAIAQAIAHGIERGRAEQASALPDSKPSTLTARQWECLTFVAAYQDENGYPPTLRDIGRHMQIRSTNGANDHIKALERKGYIERDDRKSRGIRLTLGQGSTRPHAPR